MKKSLKDIELNAKLKDGLGNGLQGNGISGNGISGNGISGNGISGNGISYLEINDILNDIITIHIK